MLFLKHSFTDPESNLALDEALLESAELGRIGETFRIWESPVYFIVLGYSSKWKNEVNPMSFQDSPIPILRRKSGGQTVLQGPGCLNFSLILKADEKSGIQSDTKKIMQKNLGAVKTWGLSGEIETQGISDLTLNGRKFSGNAMRRGKKFFLFHGTFLYQFDLSKISLYLGKPDREPEYRAKRNHQDFLTNVPVSEKLIITSLSTTWNVQKHLEIIPEIEKIKLEFYSREAWNKKY